MKKALIVILVLILGGAGFLAYDWYSKTQQSEPQEHMPLYSWTDEKGTTHFSDTAPPRGVKNISTTKGYKHVRPPFIITIKEKAVQTYSSIKEKLYKPKKEKKSSGKP
jgi:hypothetical protein